MDLTFVMFVVSFNARCLHSVIFNMEYDMSPESAGVFHMLTSAGLVVKLVLLLLFFFSITSWAIMFIKYRYIRKAHHSSVAFIDLFWQCRNLGDAFARARSLKASPVARLFMAGYGN